MDGIEVKRTYYANGQMESERNFVKGVPQGWHREWHQNGVLASETYFKNGVPEGTGKQWAPTGDLIVSYTIRNGTGIQKTWIEDQGLGCEITLVNGSYTGRQRTYLRDGSVVADTYWINNRKVSKKKYLAMCELDNTLPKYEEEVCARNRFKNFENYSIVKETEFTTRDDLCETLAAKYKLTEALSWLSETGVPERTVGECARAEDSIELVKDLYVLGSVKVWTLDVEGRADEEQNSGKLLIELPDEPSKRQNILDQCNRIHQEQGFDLEIDAGQRYILLMLD